MIVNGGDVKSCSSELLHDRRELVLQKNQVAHNHSGIVIPSEPCQEPSASPGLNSTSPTKT